MTKILSGDLLEAMSKSNSELQTAIQVSLPAFLHQDSWKQSHHHHHHLPQKNSDPYIQVKVLFNLNLNFQKDV